MTISLRAPRSTGGARTEPLSSILLLPATVKHRRGGRGATKLAVALSSPRIGVDSRPESFTRLLLVAVGIRGPAINAPTLADGGRLTLHTDLTREQWKVVLEHEGDDHRTSARSFRNDIESRELFESAGWRYIRVTADDFFAPLPGTTPTTGRKGGCPAEPRGTLLT